MTKERPRRDTSEHGNGTIVLPIAVLSARGRWAAIVGGRCPRCREGRIFHGRLAMHERCPSCRLRFAREPGYFTGAMYVSYAIALPVLALLAGLVHLVYPTSSVATVLLGATLLFLLCVPVVFRASRTLWIHLDRGIDP